MDLKRHRNDNLKEQQPPGQTPQEYPELTPELIREVLHYFIPGKDNPVLPLDLLSCSLVSPIWHKEAWVLLEDPQFRTHLQRPIINQVYELKRYSELLVESLSSGLHFRISMVRLPINVKLFRNDNGPLIIAHTEAIISILSNAPPALREMDFLLSEPDLFTPRALQQIPYLMQSLLPHCIGIRHLSIGAENPSTQPPPLLSNMVAGLGDQLEIMEIRNVCLDQVQRHALRTCTSVRDVRLSDVAIDDIAELLHGWVELRRFSFRTSGIPVTGKLDKLVMKLGTCCRRLEEANFACLNEPRGDFGVGISNQALTYLIDRCVELRRLSLHMDENINDVFLRELTAKTPKMRHLYFCRCPALWWPSDEEKVQQCEKEAKEAAEVEAAETANDMEEEEEEKDGEEEIVKEKTEVGKNLENVVENTVPGPWWPELETLVLRECPQLSREFVRKAMYGADKLRKVVLTPMEEDDDFKHFMLEKGFAPGEARGDADIWTRTVLA